MKKHLTYSVMTFLILVLAMSVHATTYYVSPTGSDAAAGSLAAPFATVQHALSTGADIVYLRAGTYTQTLSLDTTFSGSGTRRLVCGYQSEKAILSGGTTVTGWTLHDAGLGIYQATVGAVDSRSFYIDGVRFKKTISTTGLPFTPTSDGYDCASYIHTLGNLTNVEAVIWPTGGAIWQIAIIPIASATSSHMVLQQPAWNALQGTMTAVGCPLSGIAVWWMQNAYEWLNTAGYYYLNKTTGILYCIPLAGQNMSTDTCVLTTSQVLVNASHLANVEFRHIEFAYNTYLHPNTDSGWTGGDDDYAYYQTDTVKMPGALNFYWCYNILIDSCLIDHIGMNGIEFGGGCRSCTTRYCNITDVSGDGVSVGTHILLSDTLNSNCAVLYDTLYNCCLEYLGGSVISEGFAQYLTISHNFIRNAPYSGLDLGVSQTFTEPYNHNLTVQYNYIDSTVKYLYNGAGIYIKSPCVGGNVSYNWIRRMVENPLNLGLFIDAGTSHVNFVQNVIDSALTEWDISTFQGGPYPIATRDTIRNTCFNEAGSYLSSPSDATNLIVNDTIVLPQKWPFAQLEVIKNAGVTPNNFVSRTSSLEWDNRWKASFALNTYFDSTKVVFVQSLDSGKTWIRKDSVGMTKAASAFTLTENTVTPKVLYIKYLSIPKQGGGAVDTSAVDTLCHSCFTF